MSAPAEAASQALQYFQSGRMAEAEELCRQLLKRDPSLLSVRELLGYTCLRQGKHREAARTLEAVLRDNPDANSARLHLAMALEAAGRKQEAVQVYRETIRRVPDYGPAYLHMGCLLISVWRLDEAISALERAVQLQPDDVNSHFRLATALAFQCRQDAMRAFDNALRLDPEHAPSRYNRAVLLLAAGDYEQGWPEYEWRLKCPAYKSRHTQPRWDGGDLMGKTILLHWEQGLGDTIQFVRFAAEVKQRGACVVIECQKALVPLIEQCPWVDRVIAAGAPVPECDYCAPLHSLPALLKTTRDTVPATVPYLFPRPDLDQYWSDQVRRLAGFRVGICWQGNRANHTDVYRSIGLEPFRVLTKIPGIRLISLQKDSPETASQASSAGFEIIRFPEPHGLMDTAALIKNLDLVISADTAAAHLAGALGTAVWLARGRLLEWRWLNGRTDSPWYPTMRLYQQQTLGEWHEVFDRIASDLRDLSAGAG